MAGEADQAPASALLTVGEEECWWQGGVGVGHSLSLPDPGSGSEYGRYSGMHFCSMFLLCVVFIIKRL